MDNLSTAFGLFTWSFNEEDFKCRENISVIVVNSEVTLNIRKRFCYMRKSFRNLNVKYHLTYPTAGEKETHM